MAGDKSLYDRLVGFWKNKALEWLIIEHNIRDSGNGELKPQLLAEGEAKDNRTGNEKLLLCELVGRLLIFGKGLSLKAGMDVLFGVDLDDDIFSGWHFDDFVP